MIAQFIFTPRKYDTRISLIYHGTLLVHEVNAFAATGTIFINTWADSGIGYISVIPTQILHGCILNKRVLTQK